MEINIESATISRKGKRAHCKLDINIKEDDIEDLRDEIKKKSKYIEEIDFVFTYKTYIK